MHASNLSWNVSWATPHCHRIAQRSDAALLGLSPGNALFPCAASPSGP
jgi:hypothetical protein